MDCATHFKQKIYRGPRPWHKDNRRVSNNIKSTEWSSRSCNRDFVALELMLWNRKSLSATKLGKLWQKINQTNGDTLDIIPPDNNMYLPYM